MPSRLLAAARRAGGLSVRGPAAALILGLAACASSGASEGERIAELLRLEPGMTVADVGAGDGEFSLRLAEEVGETGHVFATEVDEDDLERIRERIERDELANLSAVLGTDEATGLDPGCCDALLLRLVYHHFTDPEPMRRGLLAALKPGARIVVIDIRPQTGWRDLPGVPDRGGHGIAPDDLVDEMIAGGFELLERIDDWAGSEDDMFCAVFRRPYQATP